MAGKLEKKPEVVQEPIEKVIPKAYDTASSAAQRAITPFGARIAYKNSLDQAREGFAEALNEIAEAGGGTYSMNLGDKKAAKAFAAELDKSLPKEWKVEVKGSEVTVELKQKPQEFTFADNER